MPSYITPLKVPPFPPVPDVESPPLLLKVDPDPIVIKPFAGSAKFEYTSMNAPSPPLPPTASPPSVDTKELAPKKTCPNDNASKRIWPPSPPEPAAFEAPVDEMTPEA